MQIEFNDVGLQLEGLAKSRQGIFRRQSRPTTVRHCERTSHLLLLLTIAACNHQEDNREKHRHAPEHLPPAEEIMPMVSTKNALYHSKCPFVSA
jgi:hypothetical protein